MARGGRVIRGAGTVTYRLKLPRKAKAGSYKLKVTLSPAGGKASTSTLKVTLAGKAPGGPRLRGRDPRAARVGCRCPGGAA